HPPLPAELDLAQAAGFALGHQLLGFRPTPAAPDFDFLCLLVHPFSASSTAALGQMGCSDAYRQETVFPILRLTLISVVSRTSHETPHADHPAISLEGCST